MKDDCFAWIPGSCIALCRKRCDGCKFFKTEAQHQADKAAARQRIMSLPKAQRMQILETYYAAHRT